MYVQNDVKTTLKYKDNTLTLIRENQEFLNVIPFITNKKTISEYTIKEQNYIFDINIYTNMITNTEKLITVNYQVLDTNTEYLYRIEVNDINAT